MSRVLIRNIFSNWVGFAVHAVVIFFLTPYVLSSLGEVRYGIWILTTSIIGYYGLLDLGIRAGVTQYLTRYLAQGEYDKINSTVSSAFVFLTLIGLLISVASVVIGFCAPWMFNIPAGVESETFWCILIVGCAAAIQCAFFPFSAVFVATQRYDLSNFIGVVTRLVSAAAIFLSLKLGHGLLGLTIVTAASNVIDYGVRCRIALYLIPQLRVSPTFANWASSREVLFFGFWNFFIAINGVIILQTDAILIGFYLPISAIAVYALAAALARNLNELLGCARRVFYPVAAGLHAKGDNEGLRQLLFRGSAFLLLVTIVLVTIAGVWAEDFYRLWVGNKEIGEQGLKTTVMLARFLIAGVALELISGTAGQILLGSGRIKALAIIALSEALCNLLLTVILIPVCGLLGAAIGTLVACLVHRTFITVWLVSQQLSLPIYTYVMKVIIRPLCVGVFLLAAALSLQHIHTPHTWSQLIMQGCAAAVVGLLLVVLIGVEPGERREVVQRLRTYLQRGHLQQSIATEKQSCEASTR